MAKKKGGKPLGPPPKVDLNVEGTEADLKDARRKGKAAATGQLATIAAVVGKATANQSGAYATQTQKVINNMKRIEGQNRLFQANRRAGAAATRQGIVGAASGSAGAVGTGRDAMRVAPRQRMLRSQEQASVAQNKAGLQAGKGIRQAGQAAIDKAPAIDMAAQRGTMSILDVLAAERAADDVQFIATLQQEEDLANAQMAHDIYMARLGHKQDRRLAKLNARLDEDAELNDEEGGKFAQGALAFKRSIGTAAEVTVKALEANAAITQEDIDTYRENPDVPPGTTDEQIRREIVGAAIGSATIAPGTDLVANNIIDHVVRTGEAPENKDVLKWAEWGDESGELARFVKNRPGKADRILGRLDAVEWDPTDIPDAGPAEVPGNRLTFGEGAAIAAAAGGAYAGLRTYGAIKRASREKGVSRARAAGATVRNIKDKAGQVADRVTGATPRRSPVDRVKAERVVVSPARNPKIARQVADEVARLAENLPDGSVLGDVQRRFPQSDRALVATARNADRSILPGYRPELGAGSPPRVAPVNDVTPPGPRNPIPMDDLNSATSRLDDAFRSGLITETEYAQEMVAIHGRDTADELIDRAQPRKKAPVKTTPKPKRTLRGSGTGAGGAKGAIADIAAGVREQIAAAEKAGELGKADQLRDKYSRILAKDKALSKTAEVADRVTEVRVAGIVEDQMNAAKALGATDDAVEVVGDVYAGRGARAAKALDKSMELALRSDLPQVEAALRRLGEPETAKKAVQAIESSGGRFVAHSNGTLEFVAGNVENLPKGSKLVQTAAALKRIAASPGAVGKTIRGLGTALRIVGTAGTVGDFVHAAATGSVFGIPIGPAVGTYGKALGLLTDDQAADVINNYRGIESALDARREAEGFHEDSFHASARMIIQMGSSIDDPEQFMDWLTSVSMGDETFDMAERAQLFQYGIKALRRHYEDGE